MIGEETRLAGPFEAGDTVEFPFGFSVLSADHLRVTTLVDGVSTVLERTTDYVVHLNPDQESAPGGNIWLNTALDEGSVLVIQSAVPYAQTLDLTPSGRFSAAALEQALDNQSRQLQQIVDTLSRTLQMPVTSSEEVPSADAFQQQLEQLNAEAATSAANAAASAAVVQSVVEEKVAEGVYAHLVAADPHGDREYADSLLTSLWTDVGNFDASGGAYPATGGSGAGGAIKAQDVWMISVAGTLPAAVAVEEGDVLRALVDSPGQTEGNWAVLPGLFHQALSQMAKWLYKVNYATDLRDLTGTSTAVMYAPGHSAALPLHGGGFFYWDAVSTAADDNGTVFKATAAATGRWRRVGVDRADVRYFGGVGDGLTDDTVALKAAFDYAIDNNVPMYVPAGCFLTNTKSLWRSNLGNGARFVLYGDGRNSVIRVNNGTIVSDYSTVFRFESVDGTAADRIEIRDIFIDNNASGSAPPGGAYAYEHSHTFYIGIGKNNLHQTCTCLDVAFSNVTVSDPAADVFNSSSYGGIYRYSVTNCSVENRSRTRSDVQFSYAPGSVTITGFRGSIIEIELNPTQYFDESDITITGGVVSRLQVSGLDDFDLRLNVTGLNSTGDTAFESGKFYISDCVLTLGLYGGSTTVQRFNHLQDGCVFTDTTFRHSYDAGTGQVGALYVYNTVADSTVTFRDCRFEIDHAGALPSAAVGAMLQSDGTSFSPTTVLNHIVVENCWFDPRCYESIVVRPYSINKRWTLVNNTYGGVHAALRIGGRASSASHTVISGGDFTNVTGNGFYFQTSGSVGASSITLSGSHIGEKAFAIGGYSGSALTDVTFYSDRSVLSTTAPTDGFLGDTWTDTSAAYGEGWKYVCTAGGYSSNATWALFSQKGVKTGTTAQRPAAGAMDAGLAYRDTTLHANGRTIWFSGTAWYAEDGTAV